MCHSAHRDQSRERPFRASGSTSPPRTRRCRSTVCCAPAPACGTNGRPGRSSRTSPRSWARDRHRSASDWLREPPRDHTTRRQMNSMPYLVAPASPIIDLSPRRRLARRPDLADGGPRLGAPLHTGGMDDERPPICPACGVTMVPAALSAQEACAGDWICLECEETRESDVYSGSQPSRYSADSRGANRA
jgi:hypothetical protein